MNARGIGLILSLGCGFGWVACTPSSPNLKNEIHTALVADIRGFDPIQAGDSYSHMAVGQVYQGLLQYKFLVRPFTLEPLLARAMPEISADGRVYTFKLRSDVFFHDDPAFAGKPRKLVAQDVVYSLLRLADPFNKSPLWWVLEGRIEGLDRFRELRLQGKASDAYVALPVSGVQAPDDETVVIRLVKPYRQLLYVLAMAPTNVVAREVVEKYGEEFLNHPVGTGPFVLQEWRRGQKIVFARNPRYWPETYPQEGSDQDRQEGLLADAGQRLPLVDKLTLWIYVESQPQWLNFLQGKLDLGGIPKEAFDTVFDEQRQVKSDLLRRGIVVGLEEAADLVMHVFNMDDPLVGKNRALRKAVSRALHREERIHLFYNDRAILAQGPIPPGLFGYDENLRDPNGYEPQDAKVWVQRALEEYHRQGGQGPLPPLQYDISASTTSRQMAESLLHDLQVVGLKAEIRAGTWPQLNERMAKGQAQFFGYAWNADYPDPENFLQLLYGRNAAPGPNYANFHHAEYDRLYEQMRDLPDSPDRLRLIQRMVKIVHEEIPWVFFAHRLAYPIRHAWVRNYKRNPFAPGQYKYLAVDLDTKKETLPRLR